MRSVVDYFVRDADATSQVEGLAFFAGLSADLTVAGAG